uniref:G-protein coupled receptors family 1 profile domain-containing protein n=1 Tax=Periophthalmus magnuspinnatus TaxID=409849 RepID=A0A3B4AT34_9GOBI
MLRVEFEPATSSNPCIYKVTHCSFNHTAPLLLYTNFLPFTLFPGERKVPPHITLLLVSDILTSLPTLSSSSSTNITDLIFNFGLISNIYLMLFISQERHFVVAYPQCVSSSSSCKTSQFFIAFKWVVPFGVLALAIFRYTFWFAVALLAPFPLLLFFALDSWRALACSRSNRPTVERRRAVYGIAAIWVNYSALYLPYVLSVLLGALELGEALEYLGLVAHMLLYLGPLVDPLLYLFMTQGAHITLFSDLCYNVVSSSQTDLELCFVSFTHV